MSARLMPLRPRPAPHARKAGPAPVRRAVRGFTLIEIGITLAVLTILALIAVPSYRDAIDKTRLKSAAEALFGEFQSAKSMAPQRKANITMQFGTGAAWCAGMTAKAACGCAQSDAAQADYCEIKRVLAAEFKSVTLSAASFGGAASVVFEPVRGSASAGSISLASALGKQVTISTTALGRVSLCSPAGAANLADLPTC